MKVLVVGSGAVGGYYGACLARAGHDVTFVARREHGRRIRENGLTIEMPDGEFSVRAPVLEDVRDAEGAAVDLAIVAVKAPSLAEVADGVGRALAERGVAIPLLNGLSSERVLADAIGKHRVVGGIAQIAARIVAPGRIRVDAPARIVLAPLEPSGFSEVLALAKTLSQAGFDCDAKPDLARVLWTKLLWNAPFNAVCALTRKTAGHVLDVPELEAVVRAAMHEVVAVARAEGVPIDYAMIEPTLDATHRKFRESVPSMLEDVVHGRPTEVRALQGEVARRGALHGIPTPVHDVLLALMLGLEPPHPV